MDAHNFAKVEIPDRYRIPAPIYGDSSVVATHDAVNIVSRVRFPVSPQFFYKDIL